VIATIEARDADSGLLGTEGIRYTDISGPLRERLHLDPVTGQLQLRATAFRSYHSSTPPLSGQSKVQAYLLKVIIKFRLTLQGHTKVEAYLLKVILKFWPTCYRSY
jgi:hypothetical protein